MANSESIRVFAGASSTEMRRPRLRVAILATPRSGNTWLRSLLGSLYGLADVVCDRPEEVPWETLPERCVLQLHWSPDLELRDRLRGHEFHPVTVARHPLDQLISILHFSTTWPGTSQWFGGRCGSEDAICGVLPTSREFREYATGARALALLAISRDWWHVADCCHLHYETLVDDTALVLGHLTERLEPTPPGAIAEAIASNTLEQLRPRVANQHYWRGSPGHWQRLLPAAVAREIAAAHIANFELLNYDCEPDSTLTREQADTNWFEMEIASLRQELSGTRRQLFGVRGRLEEAEARLQSLAEIERIVAQLEPLTGLRPAAIRVARRLTAVAATHPRMYESLARVVRPFLRKAG
jgi:hypothetical protein